MTPRRVAVLLAVAAAAAAAVALGVPGGILIEVALALGVTVAAFRLLSSPQSGPDPFEAALVRRVPARHDPHAAMARRVTAATTSAAAAHRVLRPILREAASIRLRRHGIELERDQDAAAHAVGADVWQLIRPGRGRPGSDAPPWDPEDIAVALDRLEHL